jgi:4-amino-4-deoxy-L-arabinose transferase-like glycosyltransferase
MNRSATHATWWAGAACGLAGTLMLRLASLGRVPLTDNTESRYATIGWEMCRSGDWITPWVYSQGSLVPFWGKPPLQFWLTALSFRLGGVSEISARLPSYVLGTALLAGTMLFARALWGRRVALLAGLILATSSLFYLLAGACALDMPLTACVAAALMAFARFAAADRHRGRWGHAFFLALAAGALAKGPVALALTGLVIVAWLALAGDWRRLRALPWTTGVPLFAAVAVPWYVLAERATPGFLRYFLVNEHLLRYVRHEYGDRYGSGHTQPYGASWLMLAAAFLPWTVLGAVAVVRALRGQRARQAGKVRAALRAEPWLAFALLWGLAPAAFFTVTPQLLPAYMAPGLPGLALAAAVGLERWREAGGPGRLDRWLAAHALVMAAAAGGGAVVAARTGVGAAPVAAAVAGAGVVSALIVARFRRRDLDGLLALVGIATAVALTAGMYLLAPGVGERHSAKPVLARLYRDPSRLPRPVTMPFGDDYSAAFYSEAVFGGKFDHRAPGRDERVRELIDAGSPDVLLFQRQHWERLAPALAARLEVVADTPHWVAAEVRAGEAGARGG